MKKLLFIIIGIAIIILLLAVWVYSLLYGSPQRGNDLFGDFSWWGNGEFTTFPIDDDAPIAFPTINVAGERLRQLTFRPVIGYLHLRSAEPRLRYAEAGTGHIFDINLETGEETRVSGTTIPNAHIASFSHDGQRVAIRQGYLPSSTVDIIRLNGSEGQVVASFSDINDFTFTDERHLHFTTNTPTGLEARRYQVDTQAVSTLFTLPFFAASIAWGASSTPPLVYTRPAVALLGYGYEIVNGRIVRLPFQGTGMMALSNDAYIVYTTGAESRVYTRTDRTIRELPIVVIPEKCAFAHQNPTRLFCGYQITEYNEDFPDDWYKGKRTFNDSVWEVSLQSLSATLLVIPAVVVGRELDIRDVHITPDDRMLYFINNHDKTLWVYDL